MFKGFKIAVLITTFNRRETTLKCLERLYYTCKDFDISVFLVDDNSIDGTADAVGKQYPKVNLIHGDGTLFWNRGMHLAWTSAANCSFDYFLWLNDDVFLYDFWLNEIFQCSLLKENKAIISGIIEDPNSKKSLYGGYDPKKQRIQANGDLNEIRFLNGNIVLIPKFVYNVLGNLDHKYHHDFGDGDYGLRAQKNHIGIYTTRIAIASGLKNLICRVRKNNTDFVDRFKTLYSPLGSDPRINFYYRKKNFNLLNASVYFLFLHFLNLIPDSINKVLFADKYT